MICFLGIDIGSVSLATVVLDEEGNVVDTFSLAHCGNVENAIREALGRLKPQAFNVRSAVVTGANIIEGAGPLVLENRHCSLRSQHKLTVHLDPVVAQIEGARHRVPSLRNVLAVGAGSFALIRLNSGGEYLSHTANTACASGTGSFLDQQALRLGMTTEQLAKEASLADRVPRVATRCAVFAKTDIIHLQQEGFTPRDIAAGLCKGLAGSMLDVLLKGRPISGRTAFVGGVALNPAVVRAVEERLGVEVEVVVPEQPQYIGALGAALHARKHPASEPFDPAGVRVNTGKGADGKLLQEPLELKLSDYPDFASERYWVDENDTEITLIRRLEPGTHKCVMGIDIGSTSTKALLMSQDREVLAHAYRKTAGDPIKATKLTFSAILELEKAEDIKFEIMATATTGSGRKFIRKVVSAETERDEITAHARAAAFIDPGVDTIIEIGGQDSKFTQLANGVVYNSVMNYVCAAGTGSFIEEQALKLGIKIDEYADFVMGVRAPRTSDRCTVFMERDLDTLLASGWAKEEAAAAVLHSIRDNYLNKVVGGLKIGERIYFQGATARNRALIAAFERELGKPITVSPYCHVTGCLGLCLMLLDDMPEKRTFRGLDFANEETKTETEVCEYCANKCTITVVRTQAETVGWGFKCGREYGMDKRVEKKNPDYRLFKERAKLQRELGKVPVENPRFRIGYPMSLTFHSYLPFWRRFFGELGCELVSGGRSSQDVYRRGQSYMTAEFCAPIVLALGHAEMLFKKKDVDFHLFPYMICEERSTGFSNNYFCPYVESHPAVVMGLFNVPDEKLLMPVVVMDLPLNRVISRLREALGEKLGVGTRELKRAFMLAKETHAEFLAACRDAGRKELERIEREGGFGIAILGRPYNTCESTLNLDLPEKIAQKGYTVFPMEYAGSELEGIDDDYSNMYWNYGQVILSAANFVMKSDHMFAVMITNFSCGPDSYIVSYLKEVMGRRKKPLLTLQLDALGGDAGYLTRVEAALEAFKAWRPVEKKELPGFIRMAPMTKDKVLFIPPMDSIAALNFAAAFRRFGYDARVLPENEATLSCGYKHTLGGECVPCPSTVGSFISAVEKQGLSPDKAAFFMATAKGPCRFGQYTTLNRLIFKAKGWGGVTIMSPSAENGYQGMPGKLRRLLWDAIIFADVTNKMAHKIRPYEAESGATDNVLEYWTDEIEAQFAKKGGDHDGALRRAVADFAAVKTTGEKKPLVGIVGEIYVRNSDFLNQNLVREIERLGGEAVKTSMSEWFLYTDYLFLALTKECKGFIAMTKAKVVNSFMRTREKNLYAMADAVIHDRHDPPIEDVVALGEKYVPVDFRGEAILTIGRAISMIENEGAAAVVNANPTFCMPGTVTASLFGLIEEAYGVPVINNFYDGSGEPNASLVPHLFYLTERRGEPDPRRTLRVSHL
jgi:predicted CoA-substrate-specific enzyme activase